MTLVETKTTQHEPQGGATVFRLLVLHGPTPRDRGRLMLLGDAEYVLGRAAAPGTLRLEDDEVSRRHATLRRDPDDAWRITDQHSRNGTFVNGQRITDQILSDQDVVRVGGHVLLFQALDDAACRLLLEPPAGFAPLVGESHRMLAVRESVRRAAPSSAPALLLGESGTGKELVAAALHGASGRTGPLVTVNCAALPHTLVESELFGHVSGAFTGAKEREGLFVAADHGTLLLDEIGDMDLAIQKALLRVLATGEVRPVGSDRPRRVDVRVVGATNVDLGAAVEESAFRRDLYARLMAHRIELPALRRRREDVLPLLSHFLARALPRASVGADAAEALVAYAWPYNVREVEQLAVAVTAASERGASVELGNLPPAIAEVVARRAARRGSSHPPDPAPALLGISPQGVPSRDELIELLRVHGGNVSRVASFLGRGRRQIYRWTRQYSLDPADYRR